MLEAARRGNPFAIEQLYRSFSPGVLGYFRARGAGDPEASTNDVFIAVLGRLPQLVGGTTGLRKLIYTIAHARLIDDYRRRQRQPVELAFTPDTDDRTVPSAEQDALTRVAEQRIAGLLARLPDDQAEAVTLRIVSGLSLAQTAAVLGRSEGAVKQLQRRGLLRLRELLGAAEVTR